MINHTNVIKEVRRPRLTSLEIVRALAFIAVFTHHTELTNLGRGAVSVFLILSGFLMVYSYYDKEIQASFTNNIKFVKNKMKKIYFLYLLTLVVLLPNLLFFEDISFINKIIRLVINVLFIQTYIPSDGGYLGEISASINGPAWYLSTLTFLYFMFPLVLRRIQRYNANSKAVLAIIFSLVTLSAIAFIEFIIESNSYYTGSWLTYMSPIGRFWDFFIGCNLGYLFIKNRSSIKKWQATTLEFFSIIAIIVIAILRSNEIGLIGSKYLISLAYVLPSMLFVYIFAIGQGRITKILNNKVTRYLSSVSTTGYIIHFPVISYVNFSLVFIFKETPSVILLSALSFLVVIIGCELYNKSEKMLYKKKKIKILVN